MFFTSPLCNLSSKLWMCLLTLLCQSVHVARDWFARKFLPRNMFWYPGLALCLWKDPLQLLLPVLVFHRYFCCWSLQCFTFERKMWPLQGRKRLYCPREWLGGMLVLQTVQRWYQTLWNLNHFPFFNVENLVSIEHIEIKSKLPLWPEHNLCIC